MNRRQGSVADPVHAADALIAADRAREAVALLEPLAARGTPGVELLSALGRALAATGRLEDALAAYQSAIRVAPQSAVTEHNLAATLGDLARHAEAEAAARRPLSGAWTRRRDLARACPSLAGAVTAR